MAEEFKEYITFTVTASDGSKVELAVIDEFEFEKKAYVAAARVIDDAIDEEGIFIYKVKAGDEFAVEKITNHVEYEKIANAYMQMDEEE